MELAWGWCCLHLFPLAAFPRSVGTYTSQFSEELGLLVGLEHLQGWVLEKGEARPHPTRQWETLVPTVEVLELMAFFWLCSLGQMV